LQLQAGSNIKRIFEALAEADCPMTTAAIAGKTGLTLEQLKRPLYVLKSRGLVSPTYDYEFGKFNRYRDRPQLWRRRK
jgi:DNA-binding IclR family transcriptional regulator